MIVRPGTKIIGHTGQIGVVSIILEDPTQPNKKYLLSCAHVIAPFSAPITGQPSVSLCEFSDADGEQPIEGEVIADVIARLPLNGSASKFDIALAEVRDGVEVKAGTSNNLAVPRTVTTTFFDENPVFILKGEGVLVKTSIRNRDSSISVANFIVNEFGAVENVVFNDVIEYKEVTKKGDSGSLVVRNDGSAIGVHFYGLGGIGACIRITPAILALRTLTGIPLMPVETGEASDLSSLVQPDDGSDAITGLLLSDQPDVEAKQGPLRSIVSAIITGSYKAKVNPLAALTFVAIESDFRPRAAAPTSSAGGLFQFTDDTWVEHGGTPVGSGGKGNGFASKAPQKEQIEIGCNAVLKYQSQLKPLLGREPSFAEAYVRHQQGISGGPKLLKALTTNPGDPVTDFISEKAASNNGLSGMTVSQALDFIKLKVDEHLAEVLDLVDVAHETLDLVSGALESERPIALKAVSVALAEMKKFARKDGNQVREIDEPLNSRVLEYFSFVGRDDVTRGDEDRWSAAFISWCYHKAGASKSQFAFSQSHSAYIHQALKNRKDPDVSSGLLYYDKDEVRPRVGDLIGHPASSSGVNSRADIEEKNGAFFGSHTDIVAEVLENKVIVIGGNLGDSPNSTIKTYPRSIDSNGMLTDQRFLFVLRADM